MAFDRGALVVHQTVKHAALFIEAPDNLVEVARITELVSSPDRPSQKVCYLDQPGRGRVYEQRDFSYIAKLAPSGSVLTEASCQSLQRIFIMPLVHHDQPTLRVSVPM